MYRFRRVLHNVAFSFYFLLGLFVGVFSLNFPIYVAGSPLARPLGRLGPLPLSLVGLFIKPGNNLVTCTDSLELCWRVLHLRKLEKMKFVYQQTSKQKESLVLSSYSNYIRMPLIWPFFRSRAEVVLGSELRLLMSFSWPVFPGLDQVLFPPWFSWFLGFDSKTVHCVSATAFQRLFICKKSFTKISKNFSNF